MPYKFISLSLKPEFMLHTGLALIPHTSGEGYKVYSPSSNMNIASDLQHFACLSLPSLSLRQLIGVATHHIISMAVTIVIILISNKANFWLWVVLNVGIGYATS